MSRIGELVLNPFVGPRFKSVVLTTDMPLTPDRKIDFGLLDFCEKCTKCARECPCGAIPFGDRIMFNGYETWKPDVEKCTKYRLGNLKGSACGRCMKTCPFNIEGVLSERAFLWAAIKLPFTRRFIAHLDDRVGQRLHQSGQEVVVGPRVVRGSRRRTSEGHERPRARPRRGPHRRPSKDRPLRARHVARRRQSDGAGQTRPDRGRPAVVRMRKHRPRPELGSPAADGVTSGGPGRYRDGQEENMPVPFPDESTVNLQPPSHAESERNAAGILSATPHRPTATPSSSSCSSRRRSSRSPAIDIDATSLPYVDAESRTHTEPRDPGNEAFRTRMVHMMALSALVLSPIPARGVAIR